jgi:hypothetical protein
MQNQRVFTDDNDYFYINQCFMLKYPVLSCSLSFWTYNYTWIYFSIIFIHFRRKICNNLLVWWEVIYSQTYNCRNTVKGSPRFCQTKFNCLQRWVKGPRTWHVWSNPIKERSHKDTIKRLQISGLSSVERLTANGGWEIRVTTPGGPQSSGNTKAPRRGSDNGLKARCRKVPAYDIRRHRPRTEC